MTDPIQADAGTEPDAQEPTTFTTEYVRQLREEAKAHRLKAQALEAEKVKRDEEAAAEAARLLEQQGKFKELADQRQAEIERLAGYEAQVKSLLEAAMESNAAFIETVPEDRRRLIPMDYDPLKLQAYLNANRDSLIGQPFHPPATNGGAGTYQRTGGQYKPLSAAEQDIAAKMGISAEDYQKSKAAMQR
jgi:hypothetical protein